MTRTYRAALVTIRSLILFGLLQIGATAQANAQSKGIYQQGDAVVTAFSGVTQWRYPDGADPIDYQIINQQGLTLQIFSLSQMFGSDDARQVPVERGFAVSAGRTGQVFGVALDDGRRPDGSIGAPNIYVTATSAFGLQLLKETATEVNRTKTGGPDVRWMQGQFGEGPDAGPGSVWKIDGTTGAVDLFANVTLNGVPNSGPALGNIAFDPISRKLFVSDLQTGMIHGFDLTGNEFDVFDHGGEGRSLNRLAPVPYDPSGRIEITDPSFDANDAATWGFAAPERQVWGVAVYDRRLFYAVASGPEIWSVGIGDGGRLGTDARLEIRVSAPNADPVSDIAFDGDGAIYVAQRGLVEADYDYTNLAKPDRAALLAYASKKRPDGTYEWTATPDEYAVGFDGDNRKTNGGVALGYGYYPDGFINYDACEQTVWSTGERLRDSPQYADRLGAPGVVHGLQGNAKSLVKPANVPPFKSYHIDYDDLFADDGFHGHMGDVAIWSKCGNAVGVSSGSGVALAAGGGASAGGGPAVSAGGGAASGGGGAASGGGGAAVGAGQTAYPAGWTPRVPGQPNVSISKTCSPAAFGGSLECVVKLINVGDTAPSGPVGFTDVATPDFGHTGTPFPLILLRTAGSDSRWTCSALPATSVICSLPGELLTPGREYSMRVIVDISSVTSQPGWQITSRATLSTNGATVSATVGNTLVLTKTAPSVCRADDVCRFRISLTNFGLSTFSGNLKFSDHLSIGAQLASGVTVRGVWPKQGCSIRSGGNLPLEWQCPVTVPSYGIKTFEVDMFIPKASGPAAGNIPARNCVVVTTPALAPAPAAGQATSAALGAMLSAPTPAAAPGSVCVDFEISAANTVSPNPPLVGLPKQLWPRPPGQTCRGRPDIRISSYSPKTYSAPGVPISFEYKVTNTTSCDIYAFRIWESLPMRGTVRCDAPVGTVPATGAGTWFGYLRVNESAVCRNEYVTTSGTGVINQQVWLDSRW